ncbi:hypothetical protein [Rhodococcus globerulus]|uniref:hypothetical protein n=1 Tax=Rhodococcus globerulus TaxID=33008 RepID=UPI001C56F6A9|nr:hypothetical protein [Rhodococcus globerulus]QXW04006.1 hypothetical protein KYT97_08300 [Rhodococcus globerulus]
MGRGIQGDAGGILSLLGYLEDEEEEAEAIQADLLPMGRSLDFLGTANLSWWDLKCCLKHPHPNGALSRLRNPDHHWDLHAQLLAGIFDGVQGGNWQRGGDPKAKRPEQLPRPGVKPSGENRKSTTALPIDQLRARLRMDERLPT